MTYRVEFTETARQAIVHLSPDIKQEVKEGFRFLSKNPLAGEPLRRELEGKRKLRIGRYRIVYLLDPNRRAIVVIAVGPRHDIYTGLREPDLG